MISHSLLLYLSAVFTGIERGGIPGLAPVAVTTLLACAGSDGLSRRLIGVLIPVYCCSDLCACIIYKESIRWDILRELVLPIAVGMFFSFLTLGSISGEDVRTTLGVVLAILLAMLSLISFLNNKKYGNDEDDVLPLTHSLTTGQGSAPATPLRTPTKGDSASSHPRMSGDSMIVTSNSAKTTALSIALQNMSRPVVSSGICRAAIGCCVGYLTVVANVSGLVLIVYLLASNLPLRSFNGTRSALLLICNGCKLPCQLLLGTIQMTLSDLVIVTPLVVASVICVWGTEKFLVHGMTQITFEVVLWVLVSLASVKLVFIF